MHEKSGPFIGDIRTRAAGGASAAGSGPAGGRPLDECPVASPADAIAAMRGSRSPTRRLDVQSSQMVWA